MGPLMLVDSDRQAWSARSVSRTYSSRTSRSPGSARSVSGSRFGSAVPGILLLERQCRELSPGLRGQVSRAVHPPAEAVGRRAEGELGVDAGQPGDVDRREQQVAKLVHDMCVRLVLGRPLRRLVERLPQLPQLILEGAPGTVPGVPVDPHRRRPALYLARIERAR